MQCGVMTGGGSLCEEKEKIRTHNRGPTATIVGAIHANVLQDNLNPKGWHKVKCFQATTPTEAITSLPMQKGK